MFKTTEVLLGYSLSVVYLVQHVVLTYYYTLFLLEWQNSTEDWSYERSYAHGLLWAAWGLNILILANNRFLTNFRLLTSKYLKVDFVWKPVNVLILRKLDVRTE